MLHHSDQPEKLVASVIEDSDKITQAVIYGVLFEAEGDYSPIFINAADDEDAKIRRMAIRYIFRKGRFCLEDGLRWLSDGDPYVRRRVINYISWINDSQALQPICRLAVEDPDPMVRNDALKLIAVWGSRDDAGIIMQALGDEDLDVRTQAIYTLSRITGEDFGEPIGLSEDELEWIIAKWQAWWEIVEEES